MWAPADLFTPFVNAIALALKRGITFVWNNTFFIAIAAMVLVAVLVVISQLQRKPRD